jgi:NAD dependent epimerase/dehydratase family enzyme
MSGVFNLTAPTPVSNRDFTLALAKAMHRKAWLTIPPFMLKWLKGEQSTILLEERYVLPKRLMEADFNFRNDTIQAAFKQIFRKREPVDKTKKVTAESQATDAPKTVPE